VLDGIERAVKNAPEDLRENAWAQGVENLGKSLDKVLAEVGVEKIDARAGVDFDHELHHAVAMDEAAGTREVVAEELQPGYKLNGEVLREAMVRVTRTDEGAPAEVPTEIEAEAEKRPEAEAQVDSETL
jgi:molecular chaperone GrpE